MLGGSGSFYQVPFLVALDLVRSRQVVLYKVNKVAVWVLYIFHSVHIEVSTTV